MDDDRLPLFEEEAPKRRGRPGLPGSQPNSLLHVGRLKVKLEAIAATQNLRWQDLAREVLAQYVMVKENE